MAEKQLFRTPAMERAAALGILFSAADVVEGVQAVVLGYVSEIFASVPFSWANIMTGFHEAIDAHIKKNEKTPAMPESPEKDSGNPGSPPSQSDEDVGDSDEGAPALSGPVTPRAPKKHHRTLAGKRGKAVVQNLRWRDPCDWTAFIEGPVTKYLGVSVEVLRERQEKAKEKDLGVVGQEKAAQVRDKLTAKAGSPVATAGGKRKRTEEKVKGDSDVKPPPAILGHLFQDEKGLFLVTPVPTKVTAGATQVTFTHRVEEPGCIEHCTDLIRFQNPVVYNPKRALKPAPEKVKVAKNPGESNVYFVPWATESDAMSVE